MQFADGLAGWLLNGSFAEHASESHWHDYTCITEHGIAVLSAAVPQPEGFAVLAQKMFADDYLGAMVVLISAMRQGPTPRRVRELSTLFGADAATIARWQAFWRDHIPQTPFWKVARARLIPVVDLVALPLSLLDAFLHTKDPYQDWGHLLRFLSPLSIPGCPVIEIL